MRFSFLISALFLWQLSQAQNDPQVESTKDHNSKRTWISVKAGYNRSDISGTDSNGDKTGYVGGELYGGFAVEWMLNKKWYLESELLFSWTDDYHFLEIPLHVKYLLAKKWSVFLGPKLDFLVDNVADDFDVYHKFKTLGVSLDMGVQFDIYRRFFTEARYSHGFTEQVTDYFLDINNGKRSTLRVGVGYRF
jgi:opacity protein-like surface antigen